MANLQLKNWDREQPAGAGMRRSAERWPQLIDRVFAGFDAIDGATPYWLEVPETGARLMVDRLYPQLGIALWFEGPAPHASFQKRAAGRQPGPHQEEAAYVDLLSRICRDEGFSLVTIDIRGEVSEGKLKEIEAALSSSARRAAQGDGGPEARTKLISRIAAAKVACRQSQKKPVSVALTEQISTRWQRRRQRTGAGWRQFRSNWRIFAEHRLAVFGVVLLLGFALMAVAQPVLLATVWPERIYSADTGFDIEVLHPSSPSSKHLLGTDTVGRDVLSVLLASTAPTFVVGLTAAITAAVIGTTIGALAAYWGGLVDATFMQIADAFLLVPAPLVMIIVGSRFKDMGPAAFGVLYGILAGLSGAAIVIRSHGLSIMSKPFIEAARVAGGGSVHVMLRHLVPHLLPLAAVFMMITATGAVIADGFVSFLGITRMHHNWGSMIFWSFAYTATINATVTWNVLLPPAIAFSLFAASFYFISRGLQHVADPKLRQERR
jgi:peptide/nickel transport system permease protein